MPKCLDTPAAPDRPPSPSLSGDRGGGEGGEWKREKEGAAGEEAPATGKLRGGGRPFSSRGRESREDSLQRTGGGAAESAPPPPRAFRAATLLLP